MPVPLWKIPAEYLRVLLYGLKHSTRYNVFGRIRLARISTSFSRDRSSVTLNARPEIDCILTGKLQKRAKVLTTGKMVNILINSRIFVILTESL